MESMPNNSEQAERRSWLVEHIKERGETDPEVKEVLALWTAQEEKARQEINEPNYLLTIELALIFKDAGLQSNSDYLLDIAFEDAARFGDDAACQKIREMFES
jgi:hypothetical protein